MSEPVNNAIPTEIDRGWYYCVGVYCEGPFETREMALIKAREYYYEYGEEPIAAIDLMEGYRPSLRASDFIDTYDISGLLGSISEDASEKHGCDDYYISFDCTDEQEDELLGLVKKAVDEWQSKNSIVVYSHIIKAITEETVPPDGVVENEVGNSEQDGKLVEVEAGNERAN